MRKSGDGIAGRRRGNRRECEGAQTSVETAEPDCALSAPSRSGGAQERPRQTKRLLGHREISQAQEHGSDLRCGHRAPTRAEKIQDVVAVVISRSSTVRAFKKKTDFLLPHLYVASVIPIDNDGRCTCHWRTGV